MTPQFVGFSVAMLATQEDHEHDSGIHAGFAIGWKSRQILQSFSLSPLNPTSATPS